MLLNAHFPYYRPQMKFAKVMFLQVSVCSRGGMRGCSRGGVRGCSQGGMHGCSWGGRVWLLLGGHAWLLLGGHAWLLTVGGHAWLLTEGGCVVGPGGCMVAPGGCVVATGGARGFFNEIRSMSGRYASYWNAFLLFFFSAHHVSWSVLTARD